MGRVAAGEVSLGYEVTEPHRGPGDAPPLVLLPGLGMRLENWAQHLPLLAVDRRVVALDLRGGMTSDAPPGPYTIAGLAADVAAALATLRIEHCDVLGLSMGGFVAQELALAQPARVRRLVLALTARHPSGRGRERLRVDLALRDYPELAAVQARNLFLWLLDDDTCERELAVDRLVSATAAAAADEPREGVRGQILACLAYGGSPRLGDLGTPTLVIGAADDLIYPPRETRALAEAIPGASYVLIDGAHLLSGRAVRRFDEVVLSFLRAE